MKMKRFLLLLAGFSYAAWAVCVLLAEVYSDKCEELKDAAPKEGIVYIDNAIRLDPLKSKYRYQRFELLKGAESENIRKAIALEPANPFYHMKYGLALMRDAKDAARFNAALEEIKKAYELKPYSSLYKSIYDKFSSIKRP